MLNDVFMRILIGERQREIADSINRIRMSQAGRRPSRGGLWKSIRRLRWLFAWPSHRPASIHLESMTDETPVARVPDHSQPIGAKENMNAV